MGFLGKIKHKHFKALLPQGQYLHLSILWQHMLNRITQPIITYYQQCEANFTGPVSSLQKCLL